MRQVTEVADEVASGRHHLQKSIWIVFVVNSSDFCSSGALLLLGHRPVRPQQKLLDPPENPHIKMLSKQ
jgi:hypothetical protein